LSLKFNFELVPWNWWLWR